VRSGACGPAVVNVNVRSTQESGGLSLAEGTMIRLSLPAGAAWTTRRSKKVAPADTAQHLSQQGTSSRFHVNIGVLTRGRRLTVDIGADLW